jgi:hypothetical protein
MVRAQFPKNNIKRDRFCPLIGQFVNQPAIDLAWPEQAEVESHRTIPNFDHALLVDEDEAQVGRHGRRKPGGGADAHVVSHVLQALEEIKLPLRLSGLGLRPLLQQPPRADKRNHTEGNQTGNESDGLQFHALEANRKTRATQGCSGFGKW